MLQAITLVDTLADLYWDNESKLVAFFDTFLVLLYDRANSLPNEIDDEDNDTTKYLLEWQLASVEYLADVIESYLENMWHSVTQYYTALNWKIYEIRIDRMWVYTSPNFIYPKFFPTWELFKKHIDDRNPSTNSYGQHNSASVVWNIVIAGNGKTYTIEQRPDWRWTSGNFINTAYFSTKDEIVDYINSNNM